MIKREFTEEQLKSSAILGWLAAQNANGKDIYFRPKGTRFVLADDVTPENMHRMEADGWSAALITETSKGNYQLWIDLGQPVEREINLMAGRHFAKNYGADIGSVGADHLGRLPGFTNRKPERVNEKGWHPFVMIRRAVRLVARAAANFIQTARADLARRAEYARKRASEAPRIDKAHSGTIPSRDQLNRIHAASMAKNGDASGADFAVLLAAMRAGGRSLAEAVAADLPHIDRKPNPVDYARRSVDAVERAVDRERAERARPDPDPSP